MQTRTKPLTLAGALLTALAAGTLFTSSAAATDRVIVVQAGQTLSQIALEQGVTVPELVALNGLADPNRIFAGQRLVIARRGDAPASTAAAAAATSHRVAYGETLTGIAARYGTSISAIASGNGITDPSYIRVGQVLLIPSAPEPAQPAAAAPAPAAPAAAAAAATSHRVAYGETLTGIAARYGTSISAIATGSGITDPSYIRVGQVLVIPGSAGPTRPTSASSGLPASMSALVTSRDEIRRLIVAESTAQGVPPALALAVAWQESGWQQGVVSSAGAIGVMQLIPASGEWVSQSMLGEPVDLYDTHSNVRAGVRLLRHYLDRYGGDRALALAAYYQGQTAVDRHGIYAVSRPYIASVLSLEQVFSR